MRFAELGVLSSEISCLNPLRYIAAVFTAAEGAAVEICDFLPYSLFICSLASGWFTSLLCAEEWCGSGLIRITLSLRALFCTALACSPCTCLVVSEAVELAVLERGFAGLRQGWPLSGDVQTAGSGCAQRCSCFVDNRLLSAGGLR